MRTYNTVDPLADIKYWWQYESYGIERIGIRLIIVLAIVLAARVVTLDPDIQQARADKIELMKELSNDRVYEDYTPTQDQLRELEITQPEIPVPLEYRQYADHSRQQHRHRRHRVNKHKPKQATNKE